MADTTSRSFETIRLAGKDTRVIRLDLPLGLVDLDPENPRVGLFADTKAAATGQPQTQAELEFAIRNKSPDMYVKLRQAIEANQGLMTPIWVQEGGGGRYVTIEGNTRVIAYRDLHQKLLNDQTYAKIPARVLPTDVSPQVIHFVRIEAHLRGVTPWDAYDRARYLYYLYDKQGMPLGQLARLTRLTEKEILNSIAAYRTMTEHYLPTYKDPNEVLKFSYFAEYHSKKSIQDAVSRNGFSIQDLCAWIGTRKLPRAADIRDLPDLLDVPEVRDEFVSSGYESAMELLAYIRPSKASPLFINIGRVIRGLDEISPTEIADLKSGRGGAMLTMLNGLEKKLDTVLSLVESGTRARKRP